MILLFQLTMPDVGSWNGKWSGAGDFYGIVENIGRSKEAEVNGQKILQNSPYEYSWADGWKAQISVTRVDAREAARLRRVIEKGDQGFCGYDWMVSAIIHYGDIRLMPSAMCTKCRKARVGSEWLVVEADLLRNVHWRTLCPDCATQTQEATDGS